MNAMGPMVTMMTDEQIELLRKQIAVYAVLCERIVEWHRSFSVNRQPLPGSLHRDPLVASGQKMTATSTRQRWTPTSMQLQILENIFDQGSDTPSKQKIKEIVGLLSKYGQISDANVYNWFQNRRARAKRKQAVKPPDRTEPQLGKRGRGGGGGGGEGSAAKRRACDSTPPGFLC